MISIAVSTGSSIDDGTIFKEGEALLLVAPAPCSFPIGAKSNF